MAKPKVKDSQTRFFRIRKDFGNRLDRSSESSYIPKTVLVELALEKYLNKVAPIKSNIKKKSK